MLFGIRVPAFVMALVGAVLMVAGIIAARLPLAAIGVLVVVVAVARYLLRSGD